MALICQAYADNKLLIEWAQAGFRFNKCKEFAELYKSPDVSWKKIIEDVKDYRSKFEDYELSIHAYEMVEFQSTDVILSEIVASTKELKLSEEQTKIIIHMCYIRNMDDEENIYGKIVKHPVLEDIVGKALP